MSRLKALLPLGIFAALAIVLAFGLTRDPSALPSEMIDRPFPDFNLTTLDSPDIIVTDKDILGEVALINVFGSWCTACVVEHPNLMTLARKDAIKLIGVNWRDDRVKGQNWLRQYGNPYDIVLFDDTSQLAIDLGVTGAPETFLIDKNGTIRYKHVGVVTPDVWEKTLKPLAQSLRIEPMREGS